MVKKSAVPSKKAGRQDDIENLIQQTHKHTKQTHPSFRQLKEDAIALGIPSDNKNIDEMFELLLGRIKQSAEK